MDVKVKQPHLRVSDLRQCLAVDYGRDVNIAARIATRAAGGEVLVTRPVVVRAGAHLEFRRIADVRLKGFTASTEIFLARQAQE